MSDLKDVPLHVLCDCVATAVEQIIGETAGVYLAVVVPSTGKVASVANMPPSEVEYFLKFLLDKAADGTVKVYEQGSVQ